VCGFHSWDLGGGAETVIQATVDEALSDPGGREKLLLFAFWKGRLACSSCKLSTVFAFSLGNKAGISDRVSQCTQAFVRLARNDDGKNL
jgi:hypothetical protein